MLKIYLLYLQLHQHLYSYLHTNSGYLPTLFVPDNIKEKEETTQ